ncbi:MAG: hypothetical protein K2L41_03325 [Muribaculaceae bacterium]|nr:hypothetical protein [Muribaculaceae bacterium]
MKHHLSVTTAAILLFILSAVNTTALAQRQRTTIPGPLRTATASGQETETASDSTITITSATHDLDSIIRLSGYDKPISASRETLHISNLTDSLTITCINFEIRYLDRKGRELHRRTVDLHHTVDPHHTELATFPTWDIQRSFYYILSVRPRRQYTPYDIQLDINYISALHYD